MKNKIVLFLSLFFVLSLLDSNAFAKSKKPPKAYSFIVEGGKASQAECDRESKVPRKLKMLKEVPKVGSYLGSELQDPEIKSKNNDQMWKHFFREKGFCNTALAKTPSSLDDAQKNNKPVLPPDDPEDDADEAGRPDTE